ncbi:conserved hypothetical protein [Tenacibaculum litopenaei]|uniref:hypothetical protein n=1 Tax=Tenacibaculum litopenaei TaxID=396016 RepID=UPI00389365CA
MRYLFVIVTALCSIQCKRASSPQKEKEFIMYEQSEMAALMNTMYHMNAGIKEKIEDNKPLTNFPERYLSIHTATLTDPTDRTAAFNAFAANYIREMRRVFDTLPTDRKAQFNKAIQSCIACHQTTCRGPIPRIKKLLIKQ